MLHTRVVQQDIGYTVLQHCITPATMTTTPRRTSSSAIAERRRCRAGQLWPKVEDDKLILQTV